MSTTLTTDQAIASAPGADVALEKRSIQMRMFKSKTNIVKCVRDQIIVPLGQIAGVIYEVVEKPGTLPDGTAKTSLLAIGEFEAMNYETGEVLRAFAAYLPGYFVGALKSIMASQNSRMVQIGIEIVAEPTGLDETTGLAKGIPFAYGVKNLMGRRADSPLEDVKRRMQSMRMLRLPAPQAAPRGEAVALSLPASATAPTTMETVATGDDAEKPELPLEPADEAALDPVVTADKAARGRARAAA